MPRQLTLDLAARPALGRDDFFISDANARALARLDTPESWPQSKLALVGPEGAGKTHLAFVWAETSGARVIDATSLASTDIGGVETPVAVDRADGVSGTNVAEEALFHLHNHLAAMSLPLLLIGRTPPARWPILLPDLKSRLAATDVVGIAAPDDTLLSAVLVKQFTDRGIAIAPHLIDWLVPRMPRSFRDAQRLVAALDAEALAQGKAVTRPMAAHVLENLTAGED